MILTIYNNKSDKRVVNKNVEQICQLGPLQMRDDFNVRNGFLEINALGINLYNPDELTQNMIISSVGSENTSSIYNTTGFIKVQKTFTINYTPRLTGTTQYYIAYYDASKEFIARAGRPAAAPPTTITDDRVSYIRISFHKNYTTFSDIMVNNGSQPAPYIAYGANPDLSRANYCYIDELSRYYYITDVIADGRTGRWRFNLKCDVLMTFKDGIRALRGTVDRQQNLSNGYIPDGEYKELAYSQITAKSFPNGMTNDNLILMTVG